MAERARRSGASVPRRSRCGMVKWRRGRAAAERQHGHGVAVRVRRGRAEDWAKSQPDQVLTERRQASPTTNDHDYAVQEQGGSMGAHGTFLRDSLATSMDKSATA
ncbi:hypothetical protein BDA96_03G091800 [Sorghum bicolor]|uniref:Uncharacterized protein n=1 Tax=Sorghum bicolor TaxID=4558 RepID=A0A921RAA5_SORBI|nr:hypothetical protein BDA96_03G091800 [Sorghum bicolor]